MRVWEVRSLDQAAVFRVPGGGVNSVDIDNTGHNIVAATPASAAYIVGCDICTDEASLVRLASRRVTRQLDSQELQRFVVP